MKTETGKFNYMAAAAVLLQLFISVQDTTIVNIALPVLAQKLNISNSVSVWAITIYQLIITMLLLPLSALGERLTYRKIFMAGVIVFTFGSLLCALSRNFTMLLAARALEGMGAACIMSVNTAIIRLIYPPRLLARGLAFNAMTVAVASGAGPTVAGAILSVAPWQWLFLINVPLGIISICMSWGRLPLNEARGESFDWTSAVLNVAAFGLIFYAIGSFSRAALPGVLLLALGSVVAYFYIRRQKRLPNPVFPLDLFQRKSFVLSILTSISSFIASIMTLVCLPFLLYGTWGFSELATGALMTPWPLATIAAAPIAARLAGKFRPGHMAATGMAIYSLGLILLLFLPASGVSLMDIAWRMAVCGLGFGLFQTPNNLIMITSTPLHRSGAAAGMQSSARLTGQTLGAVFVSLLFASGLQNFVSARLCLCAALFFAIFAACFSLGQKSGLEK